MIQFHESDQITELVSNYRDLAIDWDAAQSDAKSANKLFVKLHAIALILRESPEGCQAFEELLGHDNRGVRMSAAGEALSWHPEAAVATLEELSSPRGRHTLSAETTLREFRAGRLRFDW